MQKKKDTQERKHTKRRYKKKIQERRERGHLKACLRQRCPLFVQVCISDEEKSESAFLSAVQVERAFVLFRSVRTEEVERSEGSFETGVDEKRFFQDFGLHLQFRQT